MARRSNPYAQARPADWSDWSPAQRSSWRRRNWIARACEKPRSLEQRAAIRRARNPRHKFVHFAEVKYLAKTINRERRVRRDHAKATAKTDRLPAYRKSNPFSEGEIGHVVREFKRKYGGQALGWAKDAAALQHRGSHEERMYNKVVVALRDDLYARSNPKRDGSLTRGEKRSRNQKTYRTDHPLAPARLSARLMEIDAMMETIRAQLRFTDNETVADRLTKELQALAAEKKRSNPARRSRR